MPELVTPVTHSPMTEARKCALVVAYFLSRCDRKGYQALGFETWTDAFNKIGGALQVPPNTVKQMRESFDPYCSVVRVGWYQRRPLRSRVQVMEAYSDVSSEAMLEIVQDILLGTEASTQIYTAPILATGKADIAVAGDNLAFAARLRTGEAAEAHFIAQYGSLPEFEGLRFEDTRRLGTGFDFRFHGEGVFRAVEVKGVSGKAGSIAFTDKEWSVAHHLKHNYILAIVRSLDNLPTIELKVNPAISISVTRRSIESVSVYWSANV